MVNSVVDFVNENEICQKSLEKDKNSVSWKIARINDVLEHEYNNKLNFDFARASDKKVFENATIKLTVDALKALGYEDAVANGQVGNYRASILIPSENIAINTLNPVTTLHNGEPTFNFSLLDRSMQNSGMKTYKISQSEFEDATQGSPSEVQTYISSNLGFAAKNSSAAANDTQSASSEAQGQEEKETIASEDEQQKNTNE